MRTMRLSLVAASLVLIGGMTAACGDDSKDSDNKSDSNNSATPTPGTESEGAESEGTESETPAPDASTPAATGEIDEFCLAVAEASQAENRGDFAEAQEAWAELHKIAPPADMPADAKEGFDAYHEILTTSKDQVEAKKTFDADPEVKTNLKAFSDWIGPKCAESMAGAQ